MKILLTAFSLINAVTAFSSVSTSTSKSTTALKSTATNTFVSEQEAQPSIAAARDMFPENEMPLERIEGDGTIRTFKLPDHATKCQYIIKSNGRPMKARVEMWLGPIRRVHYADIDVEDGALTPYRSTLTFKKIEPTLRVATKGSHEFPIYFGYKVPSEERSKELQDITKQVFYGHDRTKIQGGGIRPAGGGMVRTWPVPPNVEQVQVVVWSADVGKKSFKDLIEVLHGPNNLKQKLDLQCGGGSQPYHIIIETPYEGVTTLRMTNKKFIEDGLFQVVVVPLKYKDPTAANDKPWYL